MSITVHHVPQRSPEWRALRCGRLTGSVAADMLTSRKNGDETAARRDLRLQLVIERLTNIPQDDSYVSPEMRHGQDLETAAFASYAALTGQVVRRTGFLAHDALMCGCSLDGDVDSFTGIVELKVPKSTTHLRYLRTGTVPAEHLAQIRHNVLVSGAQWADFCSYDDRFPPALQLFCVRVRRDDLNLQVYEHDMLKFLNEVDQEFNAVSALMTREPAAVA